MPHPRDYAVNEAWIVFRLNEASIRTEREGDFDVVCLMDAASCHILGNEFVALSGCDRMSAREAVMNRRELTSRVIRPGQPIPPDDEWLDDSVEERVVAVWTLTKLCYAWGQEDVGEPRLHRDISSVQRPLR
ncbi:MAG: hypothetical protein GHCLOJNM_00737 [bacterium]|nr:hypothetical protein [bacterium]